MLADKHFDKLLIALLFLVVVFIWLNHPTNWVENLASQLISALFTLTVGQRFMQRKSETNGDNNEAVKTVTDTTVTSTSGVSSTRKDGA